MTISNEAAKDIEKEVGDAAMAGMLNRRDIFELVNDRLNNRAAEQNTVGPGH